MDTLIKLGLYLAVAAAIAFAANKAYHFVTDPFIVKGATMQLAADKPLIERAEAEAKNWHDQELAREAENEVLKGTILEQSSTILDMAKKSQAKIDASHKLAVQQTQAAAAAQKRVDELQKIAREKPAPVKDDSEELARVDRLLDGALAGGVRK